MRQHQYTDTAVERLSGETHQDFSQFVVNAFIAAF